MTKRKRFDSVARASAIAVFEDELKARSDGYVEHLAHGGKADCGEEFYLDALYMAIAALREQEIAKDANVLSNCCKNGNSWISVEERLPDDSADVNLSTRSGIVGTGFYDKYTKNWVQYYSGGSVCVDVTHWMPLPTPLKEEV